MNSLTLALKATLLAIPVVTMVLLKALFDNFTARACLFAFVFGICYTLIKQGSINWDLIITMSTIPLAISLFGALFADGMRSVIKPPTKQKDSSDRGIVAMNSDQLPEDLRKALLKSIQQQIKE